MILVVHVRLLEMCRPKLTPFLKSAPVSFCFAPDHKFFHLLPAHRLVAVGNQSNHSRVICKLDCFATLRVCTAWGSGHIPVGYLA